MAETPDFEFVATLICGPRGHNVTATSDEIAFLAEQLRLIWNARGAADIVKLEAELSSLMGVTASGPYVKNLDRALRSLDR